MLTSNMTSETIYDDDFMLSRLIANIHKKNLKIIPIVPQIQKKNRKTFIFNFDAFCSSVKRDRQHIKVYLESELSVKTSITEAGMLIIDKMFDPKRVEYILEQYVCIYIMCKEPRCKSLCTIFVKNDRINYLTCEICNSRYALNLKITNI